MVTTERASRQVDWPEPKELPGERLSVDAFDISLLPQGFQPWIGDIAERLQCPPDYPAIGAMIALATVVGRRVVIRPKQFDDWEVVPNLWGLIVGRPGLMKSPALAEPLSALTRLELAAKQAFAEKQHEYEARQLLGKARRENRTAELKALDAENPEAALELAKALVGAEKEAAPTERRYKVCDSTVEKLGVILAENQNGLLVSQDEIIGLLRSLDKEGQESARGFYLTAWNGNSSYTYDRITRGTVHIPAACVSIVGCITPGSIGAYLSAAVKGGAGDDGLLQRFQLAVWPDTPRGWRNVDRFPDTAAKQQAFATIQRLDQITPASVAALVDDNSKLPFLRFDFDAQQIFDQWRERLELRLRSDGEHPAVESHLAKYRSVVPSLALLIHLADEPDGGPVSAEATLKAVAWASYLESHARRIYGAVSHRASAGAKALAGKLLKGELSASFALRDVYRNGWTHLGTREEADEAVNVLIDLDWLREVREERDIGRAATRYVLNPRTMEMSPATNRQNRQMATAGH